MSFEEIVFWTAAKRTTTTTENSLHDLRPKTDYRRDDKATIIAKRKEKLGERRKQKAGGEGYLQTPAREVKKGKAGVDKLLKGTKKCPNHRIGTAGTKST